MEVIRQIRAKPGAGSQAKHSCPRGWAQGVGGSIWRSNMRAGWMADLGQGKPGVEQKAGQRGTTAILGAGLKGLGEESAAIHEGRGRASLGWNKRRGRGKPQPSYGRGSRGWGKHLTQYMRAK